MNRENFDRERNFSICPGVVSLLLDKVSERTDSGEITRQRRWNLLNEIFRSMRANTLERSVVSFYLPTTIMNQPQSTFCLTAVASAIQNAFFWKFALKPENFFAFSACFLCLCGSVKCAIRCTLMLPHKQRKHAEKTNKHILIWHVFVFKTAMVVKGLKEIIDIKHHIF